MDLSNVIKMINKAIEPLRNKIFLTVGRGILKTVDNSEDTQLNQISGLEGETISDIERLQEYGLETYPYADDTEVCSVFINGNRDNGVVLVAHNRSLRPTDLNEGEVCLYSKDSNDSNKNRVTIKPTDNTIEISTADDRKIVFDTNKTEYTDGDGNTITIDSAGISVTDANTNKIEMTSSGTKITDTNSNEIEMKSTGIVLKNTTNTVELGAASTTINGTNFEVLV